MFEVGGTIHVEIPAIDRLIDYLEKGGNAFKPGAYTAQVTVEEKPKKAAKAKTADVVEMPQPVSNADPVPELKPEEMPKEIPTSEPEQAVEQQGPAYTVADISKAAMALRDADIANAKLIKAYMNENGIRSLNELKDRSQEERNAMMAHLIEMGYNA